MDCRAVLLLLLTAQAACGPLNPDDRENVVLNLNRTIQMIRSETKTALVKLNVPGLFPTTSCHSLDIAQYVGPQQEPLTAQNVSSFGCYLFKMSELAPDLREELEKASQYAWSVKMHLTATEDSLSCSLPMFKETMKAYEFVRCFLDHLDQRLKQGF